MSHRSIFEASGAPRSASGALSGCYSARVPIDIDVLPASPERVRTDESLRTERDKADGGQVELQARREVVADRVIEEARAQADAVLDVARDRADQKLEETGAPLSTAAEIAVQTEERTLEDDTVRQERALADEVLRRDREQRARVLSKLLPLERDKTDLHLLTERARSDDALSHRDDFLGIVSHDLRNLLSGIVMSAGDLAHNAPPGEEGDRVYEGTQSIQRYAARMNRLIGDLVDVVSIDAGKLALTPTRGDCAELIAEAVDTFRSVATRGGISLEAELDETPLLAVFDRDRMLQVLANLIANAIKFTARDGRITVRGARKGDGVLICVRDSGSGIPAEKLDTIFDRFWQVGKNDRRGLGLGLYIARCIVEAHGGRIWAESREGEGSELRFTVPVSVAVATASVRIGAAPAP